MNIVEVKNLTKKYAEISALENVNLKIKKGEFVMVIGSSGSGKSTLLHLIAGIDRPTSGTILIGGMDIFSLNDSKLVLFRRDNISLVYQAYNLLNNLSVLENILLPQKIRGVKEENYQDLVKSLNLSDKLNCFPKELSGGGRQRVAIARALINEPKIILADEPTGNLDMKSSIEIMRLLKKCNKNGKTIIMVTHNNSLLKYATRVIKIADGKVISDEKKTNMGKY